MLNQRQEKAPAWAENARAGASLVLVDSLLLGLLPCRISAFLTIRSCQPDADSALVDLEAQTALLVIIGLLAKLREFGCVFQ